MRALAGLRSYERDDGSQVGVLRVYDHQVAVAFGGHLPMIHENLETDEAVKSEVLRVTRKGTLADLQAELSDSGTEFGVLVQLLGQQKATDGVEVIFRFSTVTSYGREVVEKALNWMAERSSLLVRRIDWHPGGPGLLASGVVVFYWDSVEPLRDSETPEELLAQLFA